MEKNKNKNGSRQHKFKNNYYYYYLIEGNKVQEEKCLMRTNQNE